MADEFAQFDREASKLLAEMRRSAARAEQFAAEEQAQGRTRGRVRGRLDEEVKRGRVQADTVRTTQDEAATNRRATREVENRTRAVNDLQRAEAQVYRQRVTFSPTAQKYLGQTRFADYGAGAPPPPRPPVAAAAAGGGDGGRRSRGLSEEARRLEEVRRNTALYRAEESRLQQTLASSNPILRRHGALTTEFFQAAARGQVTIRELGFQTASTIGKFGGWLTAGAAIYTVVGALQQLGSGALDSLAGVNQLQRVINNVDAERLRGQFRDLSEHFNVPIQDSADAVYQMGKVFKDQESAVNAAKTALYAVKIGELDVATATRYLTAIVQGANLKAEDMAVLFDQVNYAQNNFGVSIEGTLAGLAKATGSFTNLGGDINQLLALISAAQKLTGQTGDVAGTAFQRIPNYLAQANNQAVLRQYGINPQGNISDILNQVLRQSAAGKYDKDQLRDIAFSIFGHFYGPRIGLPLLQNPEVAQQYLSTVGRPGVARGSAEKELDTLLKSIQERIKAIGTELQILGDNLAGTGLLDFLGLTVVALGQALRFTNFLAEGFNELPSPLRHMLSYLTEALILLRLMQRFQFGELIAGGPGAQPGGARGAVARGLGYQSTRNEARLIRGAQSRAIEDYEDRAVRSAQRSAELGVQRTIANEKLQVAQGKLVQMERQNLTGTEAYAQQKIRTVALQEQVNLATQQLAAAEVEQTLLQERIATTRAQQAASARRRGSSIFFPFGGAQRDRATIEAGRGLYRPGTFEQPTIVPPVKVGEAVGKQISATNRVSDAAVLPANAEREMQVAAATANRQAARGGRIRGAATRMSAGFGRVIGSLGNVLFAATVLFLAEEGLQALIEELGQTFDDIESNAPSTAESAEDLHAKLEATRNKIGASGALDQTVKDLQGALFGVNPQDLAAQEMENYAKRLSLQNEQRRRDLPLSFLRPDELEQRIGKLGDVSKNTAKFNSRVRTIRQEIANAGLGEDEVKKLQAQLEQAISKVAVAAKPKDLRSRLQRISDPKTLSALLDAQSDLVDLGRKENTVKRARLIYNRMFQLLGKSHNPEDIKNLAEARGKMLDLIQQQAQQALGVIEARGTLRESRISGTTDPVGKQREALNSLRRQLEFMKAHRKAFKLEDILGIQAQINDAEFDLMDAIKEQADAIAEARFELARARAGDNQVATARIDIREARYKLQHAQTLADRLQARADLVNARRDLREQIADREIEDIQFQADIGKLTLAQQVDAYRHLLKTAQLTRDQRRDLKRKIHDLSQQTDSEGTDFALNVGDIKLPTIYEIRRAIGGGYAQPNMSITNAPNINVNVSDPSAAAAVGQAIDRSLGAGTQAAMRNAGVI